MFTGTVIPGNIYKVNKLKEDKEVIGFINEFSNALYHTDIFSSGYCYHFANMIKNTLGYGEVCLAAPFGHFVYKSPNNKYYDINGEYKGDAFYYIPESFLPEDVILDFKHIPEREYKVFNKDDCIKLMKDYCKVYNIKYDVNAEKYLNSFEYEDIQNNDYGERE